MKCLLEQTPLMRMKCHIEILNLSKRGLFHLVRIPHNVNFPGPKNSAKWGPGVLLLPKLLGWFIQNTKM